MPLETDFPQNKEQFTARMILFSLLPLLTMRLKSSKYRLNLNWSYLKQWWSPMVVKLSLGWNGISFCDLVSWILLLLLLIWSCYCLFLLYPLTFWDPGNIRKSFCAAVYDPCGKCGKWGGGFIIWITLCLENAAGEKREFISNQP